MTRDLNQTPGQRIDGEPEGGPSLFQTWHFPLAFVTFGDYNSFIESGWMANRDRYGDLR